MSKEELNYFSSPAISNSDITNFLISPELFLAIKQGKYKVFENQWMRKGTIKHKMILEKESFYDEYFIQDKPLSDKQKEFIDNIVSARAINPMITDKDLDDIHKSVYASSKDGDGKALGAKLIERVVAEEKGLKPITGSEWAAAKKALEIVESSKTATELLNQAQMREKEIYFRMEDLPCKVKIDAFGFSEEEEDSGIIVDLKTHDSPVSIEDFIQKIKDYKIKRQLTYYELALRNAEGWKEVFGEMKVIRKYIISVDPVCVRIYEVSEESANKEKEDIKKHLQEIKRTMDDNLWKSKAESWILI